LICQTIVEKIEDLENLTSGIEILQKKYFLIFSGAKIENCERMVSNVKDNLFMARLNLREASDEMVNACLKKLIPSTGAKELKFSISHYQITDQENNTMLYKTVMVNALPKSVSRF
jgi:hypothetical protein